MAGNSQVAAPPARKGSTVDRRQGKIKETETGQTAEKRGPKSTDLRFVKLSLIRIDSGYHPEDR